MDLIGYWKKINTEFFNDYKESYTIELYLYDDNSYKYIKNTKLTPTPTNKNLNFFKMRFEGNWKLEDEYIIFEGSGKVTNIETNDGITSTQNTKIDKNKFISTYRKKDFQCCEICDTLSINNYCKDCTQTLVKKFKYCKGDVQNHLKKAHKTGLWARNGLSITTGVPSITPFRNN